MARQAVATLPPTPKGQRVQMVATKTGFYGNKRRREGDTFTVVLREIDGKPEKAPSWAVSPQEWKAMQRTKAEESVESDDERHDDVI